MDRPLFNLRVEQLEALAAAADDIATLERVAAELTLRSRRRARELGVEVAARLALMRFQGPFFQDAALEAVADGDIIFFDAYLPRGRHFRAGGENDTYPEASRRVLQVKDRNPDAIMDAASRIGGLLSPRLTVTAVPSSNPEKMNTGIVLVARAVAEMSGGVDATMSLVRAEARQPAHFGGDRSLESQLLTLAVLDAPSIAGRSVLLIDDVSTSGNSLNACRHRLLEAGAHRVKMFALANTTR